MLMFRSNCTVLLALVGDADPALILSHTVLLQDAELGDVISMVSANLSASAADQTSSSLWWETQILLYSAIFLLAVLGNCLVILTLVVHQSMRTITNLFLLNLAVSDLLLGVLCMPFTLVGAILRDFVFGDIMCKLVPYLQGLYFIIYFQ